MQATTEQLAQLKLADDYANQQNNLRLRALVSSHYNAQKLRIQTGNRLCAYFKGNIRVDEQELDSFTAKLHAEWKAILEQSAKAKLSTTVYIRRNDFPFIKSKEDFLFVEQYVRLLEVEEDYMKIIKKQVHAHPMWAAWFEGICGCGELMTAVILANFNPYRARHASGFVRFAGIDTTMVERDGEMVVEGRCKKKSHCRTVEKIDRETGDITEMSTLGYDTFLKSKILGVLGGSFIKIGPDRNKYTKLYYDYKNRLNNMPVHADKTDMHKHRMALRYMMKFFLCDTWAAWRTFEGLPVTLPYAEAKLGMKPHGDLNMG